MSDWKSKVAFLEAGNSVSVNINGEDVTFHEISAGKIFKLKGLASPLGKLVDTFRRNEANVSSKSSKYAGQDGEPGGEIMEIMAIDPKLEEQQSKRRQYAIQEFIEALTDSQNIGALGEIIMDSMKDIFPRGDRDNPPGSEFIQNVPLPVLGQMIGGVIRANEGVLGPLGKTVRERLDQKLRDATLAEEDQTPGSNSETPSNGSQPEGTTPSGS